MKTSKILLTVALSAVVFSASAAVHPTTWMWKCTATGKTSYPVMGQVHETMLKVKHTALKECKTHNTTCSVTCVKMYK